MMEIEGRSPLVVASINACRFDPLPEIRTVIFVGGGDDAGGRESAMLTVRQCVEGADNTGANQAIEGTPRQRHNELL